MAKFKRKVSAAYRLLSALALIFASWVAVMDATLAQTAQEELFLARLPTSEVFPECGAQGSAACDYPLSVDVFRVTDSLISGDELQSKFGMLPTPLLSSVLFDIDVGAGTCPSEELASELAQAQAQSIQLGKQPFLTASSKKTSGCFGIVNQSNESRPQIILIWMSGNIYGWVNCPLSQGKSGSCHLLIYPTPLDADLASTRLAMRVDLISPQAIRPFISNIGNIVSRLSDRSEIFREFLDLADRISQKSKYHEYATAVINCIGSGLCPK